MNILKKLRQEMIILLFRPLIVREVWGWGKIYQIFVGDYEKNQVWENAKKRTIRGKLNGYMMELDISQWSARSAFFLGRWYDLHTQKLLVQVLKKGDEVIDIGANIGMFSLAASHIVGREGIVHAFEPNPRHLEQLNRNIEINQIDNIRVYPVGLGETDGQFNLYVPNINSGEGSLAPVNYGDDECDELKVTVKVGDDLLQETAPRLIKIDVDGAEVGVLKGIFKLINKQKPLIAIEYVPAYLNRFGNCIEDILAIADEHSYKAFKMDLAKVKGSYELSYIPIEGLQLEDNCAILLGHVEDPYISCFEQDQTRKTFDSF